MELMRTFSGTGKVFKGEDELCATGYHLAVYREVREGQYVDGSSFRNGGTKRLLGSVTANLPMAKDRLTLVTEDGFRMDFYVSGSDGSIRPTGPIVDEQGRPVV